MGFFDALKRVMGGIDIAETPADDRTKALALAWGIDEAGSVDEDGHVKTAAGASEYDRTQWVRKLKRVLGGLPESRAHWAEVEADARALHLEPEWLKQRHSEEFQLLIRRAVADRKFSDAEHLKLDLARDLLGIPEAEAEASLHAILHEAESFFGGSVEGA